MPSPTEKTTDNKVADKENSKPVTRLKHPNTEEKEVETEELLTQA